MMHDLASVHVLYRQNMYAFVRRAFGILHPGQTLIAARHIEAICFALEELAAGRQPRLVINVAPRHLKSIIASVLFPAWLLGRDPTLKIMVASYGVDLALKHARDFRAVTSDPSYRQLFPSYATSDRDTQLEIETTLRGYRKAISVGGPVTGFGADYIIIDDPTKAAEARSEVRRREMKAWYDESLYSRLNDKQTGKVVLVMQRLHQDDLSGYLLGKGDFAHLNLPAIADLRQSVPIYFGNTFDREIGDILAPGFMNADVLAATRIAMGNAAFSAQYNQNPTPPEGNRIRWEWFGFFDGLPERSEFQCVVQSWDTAMTEEPTSDFSACLTFGWLDGKWWLVDHWRGRLNYPDLRRKVRELARRWRADRIIVERVGSGLSLVQELRRERLIGDHTRIVAYQPLRDKEERVEIESAKIEAGLVMLWRDAPWLPQFKQEVTGFPTDDYDDQVDALTQFLEWTGTRQGRNWANGGRPPGDPRLARFGGTIRR